MGSLSWLRKETPPGRGPVWFAAGELMVHSDHRQAAERVLGQMGHTDDVEETEFMPGLTRYRADTLDVPTAARSLRRGAAAQGDNRVVASPNHVFLSTTIHASGTPFEHGGPFGPPVPASHPRTRPPTTSIGQSVGVAVIDTGVWRDSPLPSNAYTATTEDYEDDTDVDDDGVIDGDVGHANFIIGVIAAQTRKAGIRAIRVLDTFGICTEAQLIVALSRVQEEKIVNLSLGGFTLDDQPPLPLAHALSTLLKGKDRLVVAAAGNDGQRGRPFWPAAFAASAEPWAGQVVAVAAHDGKAVCDWSNAGDWVSVAAPGADITSTFVRHERFPSGWALWSGTSFATPHVVASLVEQAALAGSLKTALTTVITAARAGAIGGYPGLR